MKVLFISAEVAPYSFIGGLAQVSFFLPRALKKLGVDIRIFTPKYGTFNEKLYPTQMVYKGLKVPTGEKPDSGYPQELICNIKTLKVQKKDEPVVYFLENMEYYEKRANVYNYSDDHIRFGLLSRAALEFVKKHEFIPDTIHANDWHSSYILNYLRHSYQDNPTLKKIATLLSIHNLYHGISFDHDHASEMDFDDGKGSLASFFSDRFLKQNPLKRGIVNADIINTVSRTYAHEILTEEYAPYLYNLFRELRGKLFGILNGLDYQEFNPSSDKIIKKNYSSSNIRPRQENKSDLQQEFGLNLSPRTPLLAFYGRLDGQKGLDLILETIDFVLTELDVQLVIVGSGDDYYRDFFSSLEKKYPGRVGTHLMFDSSLPKKIISGADILLMPSLFEPGGIVAMEAQRYGCVPVARSTGGLADSIENFDSLSHKGTGFTFRTYSAMGFMTAIVRALETYHSPNIWNKIIVQAMKKNFSWDNSAHQYLELYQKTCKFRSLALLSRPHFDFSKL